MIYFALAGRFAVNARKLLEPSLDVLAGINRFTGGRPATGDTTDWRRKAALLGRAEIVTTPAERLQHA